jgi:RNA polymerase sigma factor (sigma-70 family)
MVREQHLLSGSPTDAALMTYLDDNLRAEEAFAVLMERYYSRVVGYATFRLRAAGCLHLDANDVAQHAFARLWTKRHLYDSGREFRPWFDTMVRRVISAEIRLERRRRDRTPFNDREIARESSPWLKLELEELLGQLDEEDQRIFLGFYRDGETVHDLARKMNRTAPRIYKRLYHIRQSLRNLASSVHPLTPASKNPPDRLDGS